LIQRDPTTNQITNWNGYPFFYVGLYMSNGIDPGGYNALTFTAAGLDLDLPVLDPSDAPGSTPVAPITEHAVVPFPHSDWFGHGIFTDYPAFSIQAGPGQPPTPFPATALAVGFSINGNWAAGSPDDPATSASAYIDNLKLVYVDPILAARRLIDFNNDNVANVADWQILLANNLKPNNTFPAGVHDPADLTCGSCWWDKGDVDHNGTDDFKDFVAFETNYNIANGAGAFAHDILGVPEPTTAALSAIGLAAAIMLGSSRQQK
jgi:hypothetical protein